MLCQTQTRPQFYFLKAASAWKRRFIEFDMKSKQEIQKSISYVISSLYGTPDIRARDIVLCR